MVFTCNHCPFAKDWEQRIVELANTYAGKGIGVVLVNANDPDDARRRRLRGDADAREEPRHEVPVRRRRDVGRRARVRRAVTPEAFLFDKSGKLAYHGTIDDNRKEP